MQAKVEDLVTASASGASVLMRRLLAAGADVRGRSDKHGNAKKYGTVTALHSAVKHPAAMRLLLSQPGADPSVRTGGGAEMCPLHFAACGGGFRQEENIKVSNRVPWPSFSAHCFADSALLKRMPCRRLFGCLLMPEVTKRRSTDATGRRCTSQRSTGSTSSLATCCASFLPTRRFPTRTAGRRWRLRQPEAMLNAS